MNGFVELLRDIFSTSTVKEVQNKNEKKAKAQKNKERK